MQMFVLDANPRKVAEYLCDAHVRVIGREVTMVLSTWYWHNFKNLRDILPYKPMSANQPLVKEMDDYYTRWWAFRFAGEVFYEFYYRFDKLHASEEKYKKLVDIYRENFNEEVAIKDCEKSALFTFVEKGGKIYPGLTMEQAITAYRDYYKNKLKEMKVPVVYTGREIPKWIRAWERFQYLE